MIIPVSLSRKIISKDKISDFLKSNSIKPIVFTNGCFDIIHPGHIDYLIRARELGNFLWIGLNSDSSVKKLKGKNRPINPELHRAMVLASFYFVNAVTIFEEDTPIPLLEIIKPNIHTKGGDYKKETLPEYKTIIEFGGEVKILPFIEGESTTNIINKIKNYSD
jgi:glycerol-3-phosphate cytidylyltransferase